MMFFRDRRLVELPPASGTISHVKARQIATGQEPRDGSALSAFGKAGTIAPHLQNEISQALPSATTKKAQRHLTQLQRYAVRQGLRGPVRDWDSHTTVQDYSIPQSTTDALRQAERDMMRGRK